MKKLSVAVALFLLAGCGWFQPPGPESPARSTKLVPQFSNFNQTFGPTFPVANDGQAAVYIVRDVAHPDAPAVNVTLNNQPLGGGLAGQDYMRLNLPPKPYDLRAYGAQANNELIITVAPGQTRFLLAQPTANGGAELLELSQEQGRRLVRKSQLIWTPEID